MKSLCGEFKAVTAWASGYCGIKLKTAEQRSGGHSHSDPHGQTTISCKHSAGVTASELCVWKISISQMLKARSYTETTQKKKVQSRFRTEAVLKNKTSRVAVGTTSFYFSCKHRGLDPVKQ